VLGRCYLAAGRLPEARREFEEALGLDRENVAALKALAGILAHEGNDQRAGDLYRAVCRIDPGDLESQTALHQISSGDYSEVRSPDVVIGQGEVTWQPVRLPREEEHLSELSLGLRTIEAFDAESPQPSATNVQDFRELAIEALESPPPAPAAPAEEVRPAEAAPAGVATGPDAAPAEAGAQALVERLRAETAKAKKAPVERSMDQNRGAFEEWLKRFGQGSRR
jgi:tetratricopeptide (TPR) repeat protein